MLAAGTATQKGYISRVMPLMDIVLLPDPFLRTKAKPVAEVTDEIRALLDDMMETMYAAKGIGLASVQVGRSERVIVVDVAPYYTEEEDGAPPPPMQMINPEILWQSEETSVFEEGCLSIPENFGEVERPARIRARYIDRDGKRQEIDAEGILATCIQHEIDHLNGILFVDHLSAIKRNMIVRKMRKAKRLKETEAA